MTGTKPISTHIITTRKFCEPDDPTAIPYLRHDLDAIPVDLFANVEGCECISDGKEEADVGEVAARALPASMLSMSEHYE